MSALLCHQREESPIEVAETYLRPEKLCRQYNFQIPNEIAGLLLQNMKRKSQAAYDLSWSSIPPNHHKGPKWQSARSISFAAVGAILFAVADPWERRAVAPQTACKTSYQTICGLQTTPKSTAAGTSPRHPWGSLQRSPR